MAASRTCSNLAGLGYAGILIMLVCIIEFSSVEGICSESDIDALPTGGRCLRPLMKMRLCGTRTPTVCAMPQNVTQVFHKYGAQGASKMTKLRTVEQCVHGCAGNSSCYAVDWNTASEECWFHGSATFCNTQNVAHDFDHYKMQKCSSGWECSKQCGSGSCQLSPDFFQNQQSCICHVGYTGDTCSSPTTCPDPESGENTTVHLPSQACNIGDAKQYTCIQGHFLENNSTSKAILCQVDGTWNDTAAQCKPGNCTPPDVGNSATTSKVPPYHVHQHVDFECPIGHVFPGGTSIKTITCTTNLTFNASIPNCSRVRCQLPMNLVHMKPRESGPRLFEDHVHLDCDTGYVLPVTNQTSISLVCMENGNFNQTVLPACEPRSCPLPTHNQNLTVDGSASFRYPDSKLYRCPKGYLFPGKQDVVTVECLANGTPSMTSVPSCSPVECTNIGYLTSNLSVSPTGPYFYGSKANVTCPDGYNMVTDTSYVTLSCGRDGTWGRTLPECFKTSGQTADRMSGQPENIAAISAGAGTAAVVVILVVLGFGLIYWKRRNKERNSSSHDQSSNLSPSRELSHVYSNIQDVSNNLSSTTVATTCSNASGGVNPPKEQEKLENNMRELYTLPERRNNTRARVDQNIGGGSVRNPSGLYTALEMKSKTPHSGTTIGTGEASANEYESLRHIRDKPGDLYDSLCNDGATYVNGV
ncbi:sushi, von Willebrand factor type A, EGF and pentraxin domain-containing protein 1-like [Lingula anatina]|uniref:Sushi, von Willebrand factor type A, EGF and pentraxin domain-containing protein 1-like n=1 Tax=Lingula anatina TaxID=7574 RepID=A0A1S3HVB7_LINAN|nr:sushi, von Willebrand factor type A, EGF and pentraxin domain-containing protein 1-like [Lingula anatina]|eukprot:XP_013388999.1 sushi, von Willebrand factor type A, EGF and pentraxin domain-containing protein 1-like [Lingula anatina]